MAGLVFIGGEGPDPAFCRCLARDAGLIVAADSGLMTAENAGLRPDWILGDMDSLDDPGRLEKYPAERILRFPQNKDYTDTELALDFLWKKGCAGITIAGGGGGRLDHLLALRSLFEREKCPRRWVTSAEDLRCLDASEAPGEEVEFAAPPGSLVSVFPIGPGPWEAESRGLQWPLKGLVWDRGSVGISNRATGERLGLRVIRGRFLLILPLKNQEETWRPSS